MFRGKIRNILSGNSLKTITTCLQFYTSSGQRAKNVFLFPGQGAQYVGMCADLVDFSHVKEIFNTAKDVLGYDLLEICLQGPKEKLDKTIHCQPAMLAGSLSALVELANRRPEVSEVPDEECIAAGFSVGEIPALVHSKAISLKDALYLTQERAEAMHKASTDTPSGMISILGLTVDQVQEICCQARDACGSAQSVAVIANYLYPKGFVISGTLEVIDYVEKHGVKKHDAESVKRLAVSGAFHSPVMKIAQKHFEEVLSNVHITMPQMKVYSNVTGKPYASVDEIRRYLPRQLVEPICWESTMRNIINTCEPSVQFYELGPGQQLKVMLSHINRRSLRRYSNIRC